MKRSQLKNRLKKILHNCPYLIALLVTWFVMAAGGIGLCLYRHYNVMEQTDGFTEPVFVVWMDGESWEADTFAERNQIHNSVPSQNEFGNEIGIGNRTGYGNETGIGTGTGIATEISRTDGIQNDEYDKTSAEIAGGKPAENDRYWDKDGKTADQNDQKSDPDTANDEKEDMHMGETLYVEYEPVETDSIYYFDVGKTALTTTYDYRKVRESYFEDAVFFGDSRTLGISDYAGFDADFYCENGMTIYKLLDDKGVENQDTGKKENIPQLLQQKQYGKIYIMLGMNELGYGTTDVFLEQYRTVVEQIRAWQPDAVIYILANLHVNREKNNMETEFNNVNINAKNVAAASLANGEDIFYLDANPLFIDEEGFLLDELTFDGVHLYADGYTVWRDFLMEHGVVRSSGKE